MKIKYKIIAIFSAYILLFCGCTGEINDRTGGRKLDNSANQLTSYFNFSNNPVPIAFSYEDKGANLPMPQKSKLLVEKIKDFEGGSLYELKIENHEKFPNLEYRFSDYTDRVSLGIMYVNKTNIYKVEISRGEIENISNETILKEKGYIISNNESIEYTIDDSQKGRKWHTYIEVDGDKCRWGGYEEKDNGEAGFYETFIWKKDNGLIFYQCGEKAESNFLKIDVAISS